jgi:cytidine deaminase
MNQFPKKLSKNDLILIKAAREAIKKGKKLGKEGIADVGCALISEQGNIYTGVSIVYDCGIGFCADHSAIASMITNGENRIKTIAAVDYKDTLLPPCGRCREFIYQTNENNLNTNVIIDENKKVKLKSLLPEIWQEKYFKK